MPLAAGKQRHYRIQIPHQQYNSGDPARFGNYGVAFSSGEKPTPPCYGVHVNGTAYQRNVSDSYAGAAKEVCLSKY
jgi:hypothetical protein